MEVKLWPPWSDDSDIMEHIKSLPETEAKKLSRDLEALASHNDLMPLLKMGIIKPNRLPLYEVKSKKTRILCIFKEKTCWLLKAFIKKTRETPKHYIETAQHRMKDVT